MTEEQEMSYKSLQIIIILSLHTVREEFLCIQSEQVNQRCILRKCNKSFLVLNLLSLIALSDFTSSLKLNICGQQNVQIMSVAHSYRPPPQLNQTKYCLTFNPLYQQKGFSQGSLCLILVLPFKYQHARKSRINIKEQPVSTSLFKCECSLKEYDFSSSV